MPLFVNAIWDVPIMHQVNLLANNYELDVEVFVGLLPRFAEPAPALR